MASAKIEKGSEEWQVFMDYWQFIQKYYSPDSTDSWWDEVVKSRRIIDKQIQRHGD